MKRIIAAALLLAMLATLCACGAQNQGEAVSSEPAAPTEPIGPPEVKLIINLDTEDTENHMRVFPANRTGNQEYARIHIYVESDKDTEQIRLKLERKYGKNDVAVGDFEVGADKIYEIPTNEWYSLRTNINSQSLCFLRITLYYGEHEILLNSKTIYTPYTNPQYTEDDFSDEPPAYRPMEGLNDAEQALFDRLRFAVTDYASSGYYLSINSLKVWQGDLKIYLRVEYNVTDGTETIYFAIDNGDYEEYYAHHSESQVIQNGQGTEEQEINVDLFYIRSALTNALKES